MVDITAVYLARALEAAAESFAAGEPAYLALTSKVEQPLRDRLAWSLFTKLPDLVVTREWKNTDLAILDQSATPLLLIEAKALYTFDVVTPDCADVRRYKREVESDMAKALRLLAGRPASVFALVLVAHLTGSPSSQDVFKYQRKLQSALNRFTEREIRAGAKSSLSSAFAPSGPAVHGSLAGGSAFGVLVDVDHMVIGHVAPSA